jgi:hypothetical protein
MATDADGGRFVRVAFAWARGACAFAGSAGLDARIVKIDIQRLALAPRNAKGMVEYNTTFSLVKPIDMSKSNGVLFYSVVICGNGTAMPNEDGRVPIVARASGGRETAIRRYYGMQGGATDAHVFSVNAAECTSYGAAPVSASWVRENANAFEVALPYSVTGACPRNTVPVYRLDNGRADANPRYTTDPATRDAMLAKGRTVGGFGPKGVGMCSPVT